MKISYEWLQDFIDLSIKPEELIYQLNRLGFMVEKVEEKEGDHVLEIETYANRPDTLGHLGIAREIAAALNLKLKEKSWPIKEAPILTSDLISIEISEPNLCSRYCGLVVREVKVGPSPDWLRRRLEKIGLRSINNVVDVTNYVLMATGHPIHAFDYQRLVGPRIVVRSARRGEKLRLLGGEIIELSPENLVIADAEKPIALAGIIGGEDSAVTNETTEIFIESAWFNPISIRRTRKHFGLDTDASYRFERGADINFPPIAAKMAASLLSEFGGQVTREMIDVYPIPYRPKEVLLRLSKVKDLLGVEIEGSFIHSLFQSLGFEIHSTTNLNFLVRVPSHRIDIEREADLIEEIARFYGYDQIPAVIPPLKVIEKIPNRRQSQLKKIRYLLHHLGFDEVLNFSFSDPDRERTFKTGLQPISLSNPLSLKASVLRTTLLGGLLENVAYNQKRGLESLRLFEIGNIYFWENNNPVEKLFLGLAINGWFDQPSWSHRGEKADFFHLKGALEVLLNELRYEPFVFSPGENNFFEPGYCLSLEIKGDRLGYLGKIKSEILREFDIEDEVYAAEINLTALLAKQPRPFNYIPVSRFPAIIRDLSFLVDKEIPYEEIRRSLFNLDLPYLESFDLIDRFTSPHLGEDQVSLTLRFVYRHPSRTLLAEEADKIDKRIIAYLRSNFQAKLREGGQN
ncbi:MAG: phenylalanine--tRNA ligase subunit beta [Candidatus Aminicenantes bacterium]|nr:phenylalanine--tRNA ligase subunit beta [Candidatus Aminicenantes bacterium]